MKNNDFLNTLSKNLINEARNLLMEVKKPKLDPVGKEDADVNNDGKTDNTDDYLMARRKAIGKNTIADAYTKMKKGATCEEVEDLDEANNLHWMDNEDKGAEAKNRTPEQHAARLKKLQADVDKFKHGSAIHAFAKNRAQAYKNYHMVKEEAEQIDELSTNTIRNYLKKDKEAGDKLPHWGGRGYRPGRDPSAHHNAVATARSKLTGEPQEHRGKTDKDGYSQSKGHIKAKILSKEEAEQIDELSKKTLGSYVKKAGTSRTHIANTQKSVDKAIGGVDAAKRYVSDTSNLDKSRKQLKDVSNRLDAKDWNRQQGIHTAVTKLTKEESEQVDEGQKPYVSSDPGGNGKSAAAHVLDSQGKTVKSFHKKEHGADYMKKASDYLHQNYDKMKNEEVEEFEIVNVMHEEFGEGVVLSFNEEDAEIMFEHGIEVVGLENLTIDEAARGRPSKDPAKRALQAAAEADEPSKNLMNQIRKHQLATIPVKVLFKNGDRVHLNDSHVSSFLDRYHSMRTPKEKQELINAAHASHDAFKDEATKPVSKDEIHPHRTLVNYK